MGRRSVLGLNGESARCLTLQVCCHSSYLPGPLALGSRWQILQRSGRAPLGHRQHRNISKGGRRACSRGHSRDRVPLAFEHCMLLGIGGISFSPPHHGTRIQGGDHLKLITDKGSIPDSHLPSSSSPRLARRPELSADRLGTQDTDMEPRTITSVVFLGLVVRIPACHRQCIIAGGRGSIPRERAYFWSFLFALNPGFNGRDKPLKLEV